MSLPKDSVMLLSVVNTMLRDKYSSLEELCREEDIEKEVLMKKLSEIQYSYNSDSNQFI